MTRATSEQWPGLRMRLGELQLTILVCYNCWTESTPLQVAISGRIFTG